MKLFISEVSLLRVVGFIHYNLKKLKQEDRGRCIQLSSYLRYLAIPNLTSIVLNFSPLLNEEMKDFARSRNLDNSDKRIALSGGSPGIAASLDIGLYTKRRAAMLTVGPADHTSHLGESMPPGRLN